MERWGFERIIKWLKESDIHFILCHMHQGRKFPYQWDCTQFLLNLRDLDYHLGFPMGESLSCPIFTQNKLNYLSAIRTRTNYTLPIQLNSLDDYTDHDKMLIFASESEILQWEDVDEIEHELNKITKRCNEAGTSSILTVMQSLSATQCR